MYPTDFEVNVAVVMVAVIVVLLAWFHRSEAAGSARRMMAMMKRLGFEKRAANPRDFETSSIMEAVKWRCARCAVEGHCERWLCRKVEGDNKFCPNARTFNFLSIIGD